MPRVPQGRSEVGETVASFPSYEGAQKAVSALIAGDIPARDIAIVGSGLRSVERVTGRLGYATAARSGAINGLLLGLFFSAIFVLGNAAVPVSAFVGVLFVGVALGMLLSIGAYAIVRRRRDFASVMQVIADHYEVTVMATSIHRAREVLGPQAASGPGVQTPPPAADPAAGGDPPRYGQRTEVPPPAYGERMPQPDPQQPPSSDSERPQAERPQPERQQPEPPRYGERTTPDAAPDTAQTPAEPSTPADRPDESGDDERDA